MVRPVLAKNKSSCTQVNKILQTLPRESKHREVWFRLAKKATSLQVFRSLSRLSVFGTRANSSGPKIISQPYARSFEQLSPNRLSQCRTLCKPLQHFSGFKQVHLLQRIESWRSR